MPEKSETISFFYIRSPKKVHAQLKALSALNMRSINVEVNLALTEYLRDKQVRIEEAELAEVRWDPTRIRTKLGHLADLSLSVALLSHLTCKNGGC